MAQQKDKGLTPKEARALIKKGYAWIRHDSLENKAHWGGGLLLEVEGEYGIIKPGFRHRKTERIPLSSIKPWKSKNANRMQRDGVFLFEEEMKYTIVDLENSLVWAGSQMGFIKTMEHALTYADIKRANAGIGGMKRSKRFAYLADQDCIEIVPLEKAETLLEKWSVKKDISKEVEPKKIEPKKVEPKNIKLEEKEDKIVRVNETPVKLNDIDSEKRIEAYRQAMSDLEEAQILVMEARERADKAVFDLKQLVISRSEEAMSASV
mgnify:CR=1 FL=1